MKRNARAERAEARKRLGLKPGQVINLAKLFKRKLLTGGMIPSEVRELSSLSMGSKVLFSALLERQATQSAVFPSIKTLALSIGVKEKQARRYVRELEKFGLIHVTREKDETRPGMSKRNVYEFLYHEIYQSVQPIQVRAPQADSDVLPRLPGGYSQLEPSGTPEDGRQFTSSINTKEKHQKVTEEINLEATLQDTSLTRSIAKQDQERFHVDGDAGSTRDISSESVNPTEQETAIIKGWKTRLSYTWCPALDRVEWQRELKAALLAHGATIAHFNCDSSDLI